MRKIGLFGIILILLAIPFQSVSAQVPATYESTVNVTNVSETVGSVTLEFYDLSGNVAGTIDETIDAYETLWITSFGSLDAGFDGSLVVSSSVPLATMSTLSGKDGGGSNINYASYIGTSMGSDDVYLPLLMANNYGYNSYFYVQNTSGDDVDVDITYSDGVTNNTIRDLPPFTSVKIDNRTDETHTAASFTAELNATGPIAVAAVEYSNGQMGDQLYAYSGFSEGSTNPIFGLINENNYGYWTSANIQNIDDLETTVTVTYTPSVAGSPCTETQTIPPGEKRDFATYAFVYSPSGYPYPVTTNCARGATFVGVGVVTGNSANQLLVGIDNQINTSDDPNKGAALMSLAPEAGTESVVFPYVRQWDGSQRWWSSWTVINVSGTTIPAGDIECRVKGSDLSGPVDTIISNPTSLADGAGWLQQFYGGFPPLSDGFVGGAVCTSQTGKELVGQVNILAHLAGIGIDSLAVFEGINPYTP